MDRPDDTEKTVPPQDQTPATADTDFAPSPTPPETAGDPDQTSAMKTRRQMALGGFPIEEKIGEGGMGVVYRAFDPDLHRTVAIKKIHPRLAGDQEYARRFTEEARSVAAVNHANIAQIFAIHARDEETPPFFVMEFVDGPSVEGIVKNSGPLDPLRALTIARDAARGLRAAFGRGLIHSDIKPSNILTTQAGEVKLVDFGLARRLESRGVLDSDIVHGTPHYLAPEQSRGWAVDHRSDIYSLGCTLHYMLTGEALFPELNRVELVKAHCNETPPPVTSRRPDAPPELDALLDLMLAKRPEERAQTYDQLLDEMDELIRRLRPEPARSAVALRGSKIALVMVAAALVFAFAGWVQSWTPTPTLDPAEYFGAPYVNADDQRGEGMLLDFTDPASLDGTRLARYWTYPTVRDDHELCKTPGLSSSPPCLQWANFPEPISLPPFTRFDELEVNGLRFYGNPDFEMVLGYDPERPGNGLRVFFGVGGPNDEVLECLSHGEPVDCRAELSRLDFTIEDNKSYTVRLTRERGPSDPASEIPTSGRVSYTLLILQDEGDTQQERLRLPFSIPAEAAPSGGVALRAEGLRRPTWTVSVGEILVRGVIDREKIRRLLM